MLERPDTVYRSDDCHCWMMTLPQIENICDWTLDNIEKQGYHVQGSGRMLASICLHHECCLLMM
ncbi:hypothetical protein [Pectobacterium cacticida]|uniref:hypothetical protein n=1 Tax=Pectobacterium cacticida TaxID=69221 RepID=UPI002FF2D191